jgi:hypothetical protein
MSCWFSVRSHWLRNVRRHVVWLGRLTPLHYQSTTHLFGHSSGQSKNEPKNKFAYRHRRCGQLASLCFIAAWPSLRGQPGLMMIRPLCYWSDKGHTDCIVSLSLLISDKLFLYNLQLYYMYIVQCMCDRIISKDSASLRHNFVIAWWTLL